MGFVFSFLLPVLVVRYLTKDEVGTYRQAFQVISTLVAVIPLGLGMSAYYFLAREKERRPFVVSNILIFSFVVGGTVFLLLLIFPHILGSIFQNEELFRLSPLIGLVIWLWTISSFLEIVAVANQEPRLAASFIILAQLSKTLLMASGVILFSNVESFVIAAILQGLIQCTVLLIYLASRFPKFWLRFDPRFFREQLAYALPFGFAGLLWVLQLDLHNFFVGNRFTPAEYAIYAYGCFQLPLIAIVVESTTAVLIPRMSQLQSVGDTKEMFATTMRASKSLALLIFPIYTFLMITAHTFVLVLFTRDYIASAPIFLINLTLLPLAVWINDPFVRAYKELGRFLLGLRVCIFGAMLISLIGLPNLGLAGVISVVVAAAIFEKLVLTIAVFRKLGIDRSDLGLSKDILKTAICASLAGVPVVALYQLAGESVFLMGLSFAEKTLGVSSDHLAESIAGAILLLSCAIVFGPVYLLLARAFGLIDHELATVGNVLKHNISVFKRTSKV